MVLCVPNGKDTGQDEGKIVGYADGSATGLMVGVDVHIVEGYHKSSEIEHWCVGEALQ